MGSITYDFLANSFLFHPPALESGYKNYSNSEIQKELNAYREHCLNNYPDLVKEIQTCKSELKFFSSSSSIDYTVLKQLALYMDQSVIEDPLFKLSKEPTNSTKVMSSFLGYQQSEFNRSSIIQAVYKLKMLTPMVAANYVKLFPNSAFFEGVEEIPLNYHPDYAANILPKRIMEFYHQNMWVKSLKKIDKGWQIQSDLSLSRAIMVGFKNHGFNDELLYHLSQNRFTQTDDENRLEVSFEFPDNPPDKELFDAWVYQSINKTAKAHYDKVYLQNALAAELGANFLTTSEFNAQLLQSNFTTKETIKTSTATELLKMDLPFLEKINTEDLMRVRNEDGEIFKSFRLSLEKEFKQLRTIKEPEAIRLKKESIMHEIYDVQVHEIDRKIKSLKKKTFFNAMLLTGGLTGTVLTQGWSLVATILAGVQGYKSYVEYLDKVKEHPSFFLWKVQSKTPK